MGDRRTIIVPYPCLNFVGPLCHQVIISKDYQIYQIRQNCWKGGYSILGGGESGDHSLGSFKATQCVRAKTCHLIYVPFENIGVRLNG